jgi:hypothetical protein
MICLKERIGWEDALEAQLAAGRNASASAHGARSGADAPALGVRAVASGNTSLCANSSQIATASCCSISTRVTSGADIGPPTSRPVDISHRNHADTMQDLGQEQEDSARPLRELPWRQVCEFLRALDIDDPGQTGAPAPLHISSVN